MKMLILQNGKPRRLMMFVDDDYDSTEVIEKASATVWFYKFSTAERLPTS